MESVFKYDIIIIIIDNYLLYLNKDLFLTIHKDGTDIIGSGKVDSHHRLQNLVNQITDGKIKNYYDTKEEILNALK